MKVHLRLRVNSNHPPMGATLVEVLMSLLILAIGVVPIFTLFPISLLSSIKANQLTTTRLFADQVAATIIANPELVYGATGWKPDTSYASGSIITAVIPAGSNSPSSRTYFATIAGGQSGFTEPDPWQTSPGSSTTDNTITWASRTLPTTQNTASFVPYRYVVDPYGVMLIDPAVKNDFGNQEGSPAGTARVLRINSGIGNELSAITAKFSSPDTWTTVETAVPTSVVTVDDSSPSDGIADAAVLEFPSSMDMSSYTNNGLSRLVVISLDGRRSAVGYVKAPPTTSKLKVDSILLAGTTNPTDITNSIGQVRLEIYERRYTWLGAVQRNENGGAHLQIAVCFNRAFRTQDEQLYNYTFPTSSLDTVQVQWSGNEPYIVKGGYAFDAASVAFRRIIDVEKNLTSSTATIIVSPAIEQTNGPRRLVFMPGIVQVYEMEL